MMDRREFLLSLICGGAVIAGAGKASGSSGAGDKDTHGDGGSGGPGESGPVVRIVGVGGAGGNILHSMSGMYYEGTGLIAVNTDKRSLDLHRQDLSPYKTLIHLGAAGEKGAGADPEVGRQAALEDRDVLRHSLRGAGLIAIVAGLGGGTGSGAAPVVAEISRELGAFTIGVVTLPFSFEGVRRDRHAREALLRLQAAADAVVVIPQDQMIDGQKGPVGIGQAFKLSDEVVAIATIDLLKALSIDNAINIEKADIAGKGPHHVGIGRSSLKTGGVLEAVQEAAICPLIPRNALKRTSFVLMVVTTGADLSLDDIDAAIQGLQSHLPKGTAVVFSVISNPFPEDEVRVTLYFSSAGRSNPRPDNVRPFRRKI